MVRNCISTFIVSYHCPNSVGAKASSSCPPCPVCKRNRVKILTCLQSRLKKRHNQISKKEGGRNLRELQDASVTPALNDHTSSTGILTRPAALKHPITPHGNMANGKIKPIPSTSSVPPWAIAVAVISPILALITVATVWKLKQSLAGGRENDRTNNEMVPLNNSDQSDDDETSQTLLPSAMSGMSTALPDGAPLFTKTLVSGHALVGKPICLYCEVKGSPPPVIRWNKDGIKLNPNSNNGVFLIEETTLRINKVTPELGGRYDCIATNRHGQAVTRATVAVRGNFEEVDSEEDTPSVKATINNELPISNPEDTSATAAGSSTYYIDDIHRRFETQYPGVAVRIGPEMSEDEEMREYRARMALYTSQYESSFLKSLQEEVRENNAKRLEEYGFTAATISWLAGKEEPSQHIVEDKKA